MQTGWPPARSALTVLSVTTFLKASPTTRFLSLVRMEAERFAVSSHYSLEVASMFPSSWLRSLRRPRFVRRSLPTAPIRPRVRPHLEMLEDRTLPTVFNVAAGDVAGLIADIDAANLAGGSNTINLTASTYDLLAANNN